MESDKKENKYFVGPGFGLFIMGLAYLIFWLTPVPIETFIEDPRWAHNWAYAIIIMTIGASFHHKSILSRFIALVQAFLMPLTASGAFNTFIMTIVTIIVGCSWLIVVFIERRRGVKFLDEKYSKRASNWVPMHITIICWILMGHMGLVWFFGRLPFEAELDHVGTWLLQNLAMLKNLPPERFDLVTSIFDLNLIILALLFGYEQYKLGYNINNNPWPKYSFYYIIITIATGFVFLPVNLLYL